MRAQLVCLFFLMPIAALAQWSNSGSRADSWEVSVGAIYQRSESVGGSGSDSMAMVSNSSSLRVEDEWGYTFNGTYFFTDHLALGVDLDFIRPRYQATLVPDDANLNPVTINHRASQFNGRIKGSYLFSKNAFSPFVELGLGWSNFDSNVASGPPITGCWWHPWWGYVCSNFYDTFSSTEFTYGAGVGLRYELLGDGVIKASYSYWELDSGGQSSDFGLEGARLEFAWRF